MNSTKVGFELQVHKPQGTSIIIYWSCSKLVCQKLITTFREMI